MGWRKEGGGREKGYCDRLLFDICIVGFIRCIKDNKL